MCLACFFVMISFQSIDQIVWNVGFTQTPKLLQHIELRAMGGSRSLALSLHVDMAMICHLLKLSNNALTQVGQAAEHNIISCISHIPWAGLVFVLMLYFVLLYMLFKPLTWSQFLPCFIHYCIEVVAVVCNTCVVIALFESVSCASMFWTMISAHN